MFSQDGITGWPRRRIRRFGHFSAPAPEERLLSFLCYIAPPVTSIGALIMARRRKFIRFHAYHSLCFVAWYIGGMIILDALAALFGLLNRYFGLMWDALLGVYSLFFLFLWIRCLLEAYKGRYWSIPIIGLSIANRR